MKPEDDREKTDLNPQNGDVSSRHDLSDENDVQPEDPVSEEPSAISQEPTEAPKSNNPETEGVPSLEMKIDEDDALFEKAAKSENTPQNSNGGFVRKLTNVGIILLISAVGIFGAFYVKNFLTKSNEDSLAFYTETDKNLVVLKNQIETLSAQYSDAQGQVLELEKKLSSTIRNNSDRLRAAEERLQAQNRRLLSLSTTTREDWLLAEAEYLLKLANQRIYIEKDAKSSLALLLEADTIIKNLADPDLFPVRKILQRDIAKLKLVKKVDQEGIYLSLLALAEQVESLPALPHFKKNTGSLMKNDVKSDAIDEELAVAPSVSGTSVELSETESASDSPVVSGVIEKIAQSYSSLLDSLQSSFNVVDYDDSSMTLVSPRASIYVRQNLRLILERAQLALLREQQTIYQSSLSQAITWLQQYFPRSEQRQVFIDQIRTLVSRNIVQPTPTISESLELLASYIEELHQLQGNNTNSPQLNNEASEAETP